MSLSEREGSGGFHAVSLGLWSVCRSFADFLSLSHHASGGFHAVHYYFAEQDSPEPGTRNAFCGPSQPFAYGIRTRDATYRPTAVCQRWVRFLFRGLTDGGLRDDATASTGRNRLAGPQYIRTVN